MEESVVGIRRFKDKENRALEPIQKGKSDSAARQGEWRVKQSGHNVKHQTSNGQLI